MRVLIYPSDRGPCGNYRLILTGKAVRQQHPGWRVEFGDLVTLRNDTPDLSVCDVVVIQRPVAREAPGLVKAMRSKGVAVVVDMDDDLSCVHPRNPAARAIKTRHLNAAEACEEATLVTTTTPALDARYGFGHGLVIPNYIPAHYLDQSHRDNDTIGWAGDIRTHPADVDVPGEAMKRMAALGASFFVAGPGTGVAKAWQLRSEVRASGTIGLSDWPSVVSKIGIGVAPLEASAFNNAKSRLKCLEMASVGVPWVASPSPDYISFHEEGCGLIASTPDEWFRHLRRLYRNPGLRQEMSEAGREVASRNTIQKNAWKWADAWSSAVEKEKAHA